MHQGMNFFSFATNSGGMHRKVFERSVSRIAPAHQRDRGDLALVPAAMLDPPAAQSVQGFVDSIEWHQLNDKRVCYVRANIMQPIQDMRITLTALLVGTEEEVSKFLFSRNTRSDDERPVVMQFAYVPTNPALPLRQYISSLWHGEHPSFGLLCAAQGCRDQASLIQRDPVAAHEIRWVCAKTEIMAMVCHFHRFM